MDPEELQEKKEEKKVEKLRRKKEAKKAALKEELKRKKKRKRRRKKRKRRKRRRRRRRRKTQKDKEDAALLNEENTWIPHKVNQRRLMEDLLIFLHKFEAELENIFEERDRTREEDHIYKKIKHIFRTAEKEYDDESIYDMERSPYLRWNPPLWAGPDLRDDQTHVETTEKPQISAIDGHVLQDDETAIGDEEERLQGKDPGEDRRTSQSSDVGNDNPNDIENEGDLWSNFYVHPKDGGKNEKLEEAQKGAGVDADPNESFDTVKNDQKRSADMEKDYPIGKSLDQGYHFF